MAEHGMYVANRDVVIETNKGYSFRFKKDVPLYVPPLVREEVLQYGILPVDGELPIVEEVEKPAEPMGAERNALILEGVSRIIRRREPKDFTAGGVPREDVFEREMGFNAARRELNAAFKKYRQQESEAKAAKA